MDDSYCDICGSSGAVITTAKQTVNGLPTGVMACRDCRQAIQRRELGVVLRPDGQLYITDGRRQS